MSRSNDVVIKASFIVIRVSDTDFTLHLSQHNNRTLPSDMPKDDDVVCHLLLPYWIEKDVCILLTHWRKLSKLMSTFAGDRHTFDIHQTGIKSFKHIPNVFFYHALCMDFR